MRKIISLGLFALILSIFSSQVFAGKVSFCEDKKDELKSYGLYGLCNAYWNADDENDKGQILANFVKKAGTSLDAPGMPGLTTADCPCWEDDSGRLEVAVNPSACQLIEGYVHVGYNENSAQYTVFPPTTKYAASCMYSNFGVVSSGFEYMDLNFEEYELCTNDLVEFIAADFPDC
jgi:hypothetical protein